MLGHRATSVLFAVQAATLLVSLVSSCMNLTIDPSDEPLLGDLRGLIDAARSRAAVAVNAEMTLLYWQVGVRIRDHVLQGERAAYGKQVVTGLARALSAQFGRGWSAQHLRHCLRIAETFPDEANLSAVRRQLNWTHLKTLMYLEDPLRRDFYLELCRREGWSTRRLSERIRSMLYERTAISKKPDQTIRADLDQLRDEGNLSTALAFRDPYVLDFLELQNTYSEGDLESAILA